MKNHRRFVGVLLAVLVVALVSGVAYLARNNSVSKVAEPSYGGQPMPSLPPSPPPAPPYQKSKLLTQAPEEPQDLITEVDFNLVYPNGGEVFNLNQAIQVNYSISDSFRNKLSSSDLTELYLLDTNNVLVGYIGEININKSEFVWNPQQLEHNAGLTFLISPPPAGQYRILLLSRHPTEPWCTNCDLPVDTLDGPYTFEKNGYLVNSETAKLYDSSYVGARPLASDVSASFFTIK